MDDHSLSRLADIYRDLHRHPELSMQETRTAAIAADWLREHGYAVHTEIGTTGVVGVFHNGAGATVLLRADIDALPLTEATELDYASETPGVMHACGHDMHAACLMGAAAELVAHRTSWSGTAVVVFQPGEEIGQGAQAMVDGGLYDLVPRPDVVLGQHVAPLPAGVIGLRSGPAFAASDVLRVTMFGRGGHGSRPETTVDPVVMAASTVLRLQTVVSRETAATDTAVLTVGSLHAGTKANIIPDRAELALNLRTYDEAVRARILEAVTRIVNSEAAASSAPAMPTIERTEVLPAVVNDPSAVDMLRPVLEDVVGRGHVVDPGTVTGSEDVGILAGSTPSEGVPLVFWLLGGADPELFAHLTSAEQVAEVAAGLPSNHSPFYAPVIDPTLTVGISALTAAAKKCFARAGDTVQGPPRS
ncbi:amidohydrolase [Nocardioides okcheonensis]|uniref:amidohydrolase n=1 Tax=Nocardioides okcheonensis TaxID=2894081 RepID=UPI001E2CDEE3|nr:amidohydrolase [Nocardioides okcheonensis]UFN45120.1 amidohydrolase [Nocardioides okcheonensis]